MGKVLLICTNCLYSKTSKQIETDPKETKFIVIDNCPKCNAEQLDEIEYRDKNFKLINHE